MGSPDKSQIQTAFRELQSYICSRIEAVDGQLAFGKDEWQHKGGGGGLSRVGKSGAVIDKAGVNFSAVEGRLTAQMADSIGVEVSDFFATGASIVMHPHSPMVPIIHMNVRYFETEGGIWWFGGGIDLTPHYIDAALAGDFHREVKALCDRYDANYYKRFKQWADTYFYNQHREETRGIGGIFFDRLNAGEGKSKQELFDFCHDLARAFPDIYAHQIAATREIKFAERHKKWQLLRRGRYVEFNLVYDRGTRFGLFGNGRVESILMSLPALASWEYDHQVEPGSEEEYSLSMLRKGVDWLSFSK